MASRFITNQDDFLSELVNNIIPSSQEMLFLVGYFYFSGFEQVYKNIGDKHIKILIGMDIERELSGAIKEYTRINAKNRQSRSAERNNFYKYLTDFYNNTDFFDTQKQIEAFKFFISKIENKTLEVRKTVEQNHAKLYIFMNEESHSQGGSFPGTVITGSSNLSISGMKERSELNVILRDSHDYNDALKIFSSLWETAIPLIDELTRNEFYEKVIEHIWYEKLPSPYIVFLRVLHEYFSIKNEDIKLPSEITRKRYFNLQYQVDAISQGISILKKHSGCIIADVVGLGKSIIASAIAHNIGLKVIIICPPHLWEQWNSYRSEFWFNAQIYSSGKIQEALDDHLHNKEEKLVIIDEAHRYRNEEIIDYGLLHKLCQGNKVLLLSATPFNNRPQDIFSLIKLFQIPAKSTIQTVENLTIEMHLLIAEYRKLKNDQRKGNETGENYKKRAADIAERIRDILSPVMIRRTRLDLEAIDEYREDLRAQNLIFPRINPPDEVDYNLGPLTTLYVNTLYRISPEDSQKGFTGARYRPFTFLIPGKEKKYSEALDQEENLLRQSQFNLSQFMKRLLVRRFESSIHAFRSTLESMIESYQNILGWHREYKMVPLYKKGTIPDVDDFSEIVDDYQRGLSEATLEEILKTHLEKDIQKGLVFIESLDLNAEFEKQLRMDLDLLRSIREDWAPEKITHDPKADEFVRIVKESLRVDPQRKLVVFSEFADTINYLYDRLANEGLRVFKFTSADSNPLTKRTIRNNFDAGCDKEKQAHDYDILLATDAISEGFNLHRAGTIYNYDIPYNPTRVIQRVGRINRINFKVFDDLYIYNFFPTTTGEDITHTKLVSTFKMAIIQAILGADMQVLTRDEEIRAYFAEQYNQMNIENEAISWDVEYLNILNRARHQDPEAMEKAISIPRRSRIRRTVNTGFNGVLLFAKKGPEYRFNLTSSPDNSSNISAREALAFFQAKINEDPAITSDIFHSLYEKAKSSLFVVTKEMRNMKQATETIERIQKLLSMTHEADVFSHEYLARLLFVIEELGSLPDVYMKAIRKIKLSDPRKAVNEIQDIIPEWYIDEIMKKEEHIGAEPEEMILSEESCKSQ